MGLPQIGDIPNKHPLIFFTIWKAKKNKAVKPLLIDDHQTNLFLLSGVYGANAKYLVQCIPLILAPSGPGILSPIYGDLLQAAVHVFFVYFLQKIGNA